MATKKKSIDEMNLSWWNSNPTKLPTAADYAKLKAPKSTSTLPSPKEGSTMRLSNAKVTLPSATKIKLPTIKATIPEAKLTLGSADDKFRGKTSAEKLSNAVDDLLAPIANTTVGKIATRGQDAMYKIWDKQSGVDKLGKTGRGDGKAGYVTDTGSEVGNAVGDIIGFGGTMISNTGGGSVQGALSPIGNAAAKVTTKGLEKVAPSLPSNVNKVANYVLPTLAKEGVEGAIQGGTLGVDDGVQGVAKEAAKGAVENAIFGMSLKGAGDIFSHTLGKLGKVKVNADDGVNVTYTKEDGSTGSMKKTIFDKEATPLTVNEGLSTLNQSKVSELPTFKGSFDNKVTNELPTVSKVETKVEQPKFTDLNGNEVPGINKDYVGIAMYTHDGMDYPVYVDGYFKNHNGVDYVYTIENGQRSASPVSDYRMLGEGEEKLANDYFKRNNIDTPKTQSEPITATLDNGQVSSSPKVETPVSEPIEGGNHVSIGATNRTHIDQDIIIGPEDTRTKKEKLADGVKNLRQHGVDIYHSLRGLTDSGATHVKAVNSRKVAGTVSHIHSKELVDMEGNPIGESLKSIAKDMPQEKEAKKDFMYYVLQKHNIDRAREEKNVFPDWNSYDSEKYVQLMDKTHPEYKALNDRLVKFVNTFMTKWGKDSGLITDDLWDELNKTYKNYVPTNRDFSDLEKGVKHSSASKAFVDTGNGLKKATGSERDIIDPTENIMNLVNRYVRLARNNEVGQSVLKTLRENPEGNAKLAEIVPEGVEINPNVNHYVTVLEKGKPIDIKVNDLDFLESLKNVYKQPELLGYEKALATGTQHFKNLITTDNPLFAVFNAARDLPAAYIYGSEGNPVKFARDYLKAMGDVISGNLEGSENSILKAIGGKIGDSSKANRYKAVGGTMADFFNPGESAMAVKNLTGKKNVAQKGLGVIRGFNEAIETAPRLAEFNRALERGDDISTALAKAGEVTVDFSKGGDWTKKIDQTGVPYLNASVQGIDRFARAMKYDTKKTLTRSAFAVTFPTVALNLINWDNENYKALDNRTKDTYFCIPNVADGGKTFIKLPKTKETGVLFGALTERLIRLARGDEEAFKGFGGVRGTVANNFVPVNPLESNLVSPILNLRANKDFADRTIVPETLKDASPYNQYDEQTSVIAKALGQAANLSPKQIDYLIKSYTGVVGQFVVPMATRSNYDTNGVLPTITKPFKTKFVADPLYSNQAITDFYDNYDMLKTIAKDYNIENNVKSEDITVQESYSNRFAKYAKDMSELSKAAKNASSTEEQQSYRQQMIKLAEEANSILPTQSIKKLKKTFNNNALPMLNNKSSNNSRESSSTDRSSSTSRSSSDRTSNSDRTSSLKR